MMSRTSSHILALCVCHALVFQAIGCAFDKSGLVPPDASVNPRPDGTLPDAALPDAALPDAALPDAAPPDGAAEDAGPDATLPDATLPDAASPDGTVEDAGPDASTPGCGNGVLELGEECDGLDLGTANCITRGYDDGILACTSGCLFDESACTTCGDGVAEGNEMCDKTDLRGASCVSRGFDSGDLACRGDCIFDESDCTICGDAVVGGDEECDQGPANSDILPDRCRTDCTLPRCGDGVCDTVELGGFCPQDCTTVVFWENFEGTYPGGWTANDDNDHWATGKDYWGRVTKRHRSATRSLWCAANGRTSYYDNNMDAWANHSVDLSPYEYQTITLSLWVWVNVYNSSDWYETRYHNGTEWVVLGRISSDTSGWEQMTYDISSQAGNGSFVLRLFFHSNGSLFSEGAYVDDILITALR